MEKLYQLIRIEKSSIPGSDKGMFGFDGERVNTWANYAMAKQKKANQFPDPKSNKVAVNTPFSRFLVITFQDPLYRISVGTRYCL